MKILYTYQTEEEKVYMSEKLSEHEVVFHLGSLQDDSWSGDGVECLCIFVSSIVSKAELDKLPNLKFIATRSTGYDHIDTQLAHERSIVVSSVPAYGEHTVAEYAFALLLMLSRNMFSAHEKVMQGSFSSDGLSGFDLQGKTIGILGTGKIGKNAIKIAQGFGMRVLAFDLYPDQDFSKENSFEYKSLEEILGVADIISLHLPESKETRHIINKDMVGKMKKGMVLINTARGSLIETDALVWGLQENIIFTAGLDVLDEEGYVADEMRLLGSQHPKENELKTLLMNHYLINHPRVIITPHNAFNTKEALQRILDVTIVNISGFTAGNFQNVVK
jgi:D-lactate dehydrogenase